MATVCQTCGDKGYEEALIYCDSCEISAMHRYCLDITPVPFEDYITWFCTTCNGSDSERREVDQTAKLKHILKKKKKTKKKKLRVNPELDEMNTKSTNFSSEGLDKIEDHGLQDDTNVEPAKMVCNGTNSGSAREEVSHVQKKKKKKRRLKPDLDEMNTKSTNSSSEVLGKTKDHGLQDDTNVEPAKMVCTGSNSGSAREEVSHVPKKKKKKRRLKPDLEEMNTKSTNFRSEVLGKTKDHGLQDDTNVEPGKMVGTGSNGGSAREGVSHVQKKKKKKRRLNPELDEINKKSSNFSSGVLGRSEDHRLQDSTSVEPAKIACTQDDTNVEPAKMGCTQDGANVEPTKMGCTGANSGSDHEEADQTAKLRHVLQKKKKTTTKKKKLRVNPELDEMNKKSSNVSSEVLGRTEDHGLQDGTNVEPAKMACDGTNVESETLACTQDGANVEPAKMACTQDGTNVESAKMACTQDDTNVEPAKMVCTGSNSGSDHAEVDQTAKLTHVMKKTKRKQKANPGLDEMNKKSSHISSPVLGKFEDHGLQDDDNVEPAKVSSLPIQEIVKESEKIENSESKKPHKLTGLDRNESPVLEPSNSSTVPDHDSSSNKKRKLSSGNCEEEPDSFKPKTPFAASVNCRNKSPLTCENNQLAVWKSSCNDVVSNKPQTSEGLTDLHFNSRAAQPVIQPIWRGSLSIKQGKIHDIDGVVAHLSRLACPQVYEAASSLRNRLSAEMFPRLDIWPRSFLQRGVSDESIALYFFSSESNEKVFDSLVLEMKKNDFAMRAILDDAELLLFTSVTLPVHFWTFQAKYYLWGVFRAKQKSRHM